jgi:hypothetical protein
LGASVTAGSPVIKYLTDIEGKEHIIMYTFQSVLLRSLYSVNASFFQSAFRPIRPSLYQTAWTRPGVLLSQKKSTLQRAGTTSSDKGPYRKQNGEGAPGHITLHR